MGSTANTASGIPQFNGGPDFQHWSFRVKMHLDSVGVLNNLTEIAPQAPADKVKFEEADRKAKALIVSFLANECLEVIREKSTAKDMWEALEATFATKSIGSQHLIRKQLNRLKLKEGEPMRPHLLVFDEFIRQMKTAGAKVDEADLVVLLFQTLPDSYDPLVTALENVPEKDLKIEVVKQRLLAEDMKRQERNDQDGEAKGAAFSGDKTKKPFKFQGKCHKCGKRGHFKKDCRQKLGTGGEANAAENKRKAVSFVANRSSVKRKSG